MANETYEQIYQTISNKENKINRIEKYSEIRSILMASSVVGVSATLGYFLSDGKNVTASVGIYSVTGMLLSILGFFVLTPFSGDNPKVKRLEKEINNLEGMLI